MKHQTVFLCLFLSVLVSCRKDDPPAGKDDFGISVTALHFTAEKDASLVVVKAGSGWTATCEAEWIELSAYEGDESTGFLVGASANTGFPRETVVRIASDGETGEIRVYQSGVSSILFEFGGTSFALLPVAADTTFYLDGDTYLASRSVFLDSYFISETEITNAQWVAIMGSLPYEGENSSPELPVVVNWDMIHQKFIPRINELTGYQFRLPTENEWEVAARGGKDGNHSSYAGSINIDDIAWHFGNSEGRKHEVGTKDPNELGLYDMSGNVSEWCSDWYAEWTEENPPPAESTNPSGPATGTDKVIRGGDFMADRFEYDRNSCRVTSRNHLPPGIDTGDFLYEGYYHFTGFRLVLANSK
jgi:hypothetical protein